MSANLLVLLVVSKASLPRIGNAMVNAKVAKTDITSVNGLSLSSIKTSSQNQVATTCLRSWSTMRLSARLIWIGVALESCTVSGQALLYISDAISSPTKNDPPSISPITARLLLAQRLGLSQYHSLEDADESAIDILNIYGGREEEVFRDEDGANPEKLLLLVEGVSNPEGILRNASLGAK